MGIETHEGIIMPPKPDYPTAIFQYEMFSPETTSSRLERLSRSFDKREKTVMVRMGQPTGGIVETPFVNVTHLDNTTYQHEVYIPINLPTYFSEDFIDFDSSSRSEKGRRRIALEKDLETYVEGGLELKKMNPRSRLIEMRRKTEKTAPRFPRLAVLGSTGIYSPAENGLVYYLSPSAFNTESPVNQALFQHEMRDALTMTFIYATHLLRFRHASASLTHVVVDPNKFKMIYRSGIMLTDLNDAELQRLVARGTMNLPDPAPPGPNDEFISMDDEGNLTFDEDLDDFPQDPTDNGKIIFFPRKRNS